MLAGVFNNFRNICLKIFGLDPAHFISAPGITWRAALNRANVNLDLLTDIGVFLMAENGIRDETCHAINRYVKANEKYMKDYD